ncbi:MAG: transposase, IS4 family protein [uncultured Chloroflexia bacterium]|uniref:Transposase, IS4 family protein n=1 Tax=uncultured Chloroflexia bacterium TaxID=1672391 RepID=A0A6J4NHZ9_9CHLR|nr:MAG: transposase, IS4 family protein [uncultured Chloroflexia bacterium]
MSDTYRRYRAIKHGLLQFFPHLTGHRERHLNTLVALICGLAGSQRAHLSSIADHAPSHGADQESVITRFRRWLKNEKTTITGWFLPVAEALLANLAQQPLVLVIDGSVVGRGCLALMLSVVYHGRALPLAWIVVKGKKGHFPQQTHCDLLAQIQELIPEGADVTVLGDGEFDGTEFQAALRKLKWKYVCRTAPNLLMSVEGRTFTIGAMAPTRGEKLGVRPAWVTAEEYGPVSILAIWEAAYEEPLYLVTNMVDLEAAIRLYRKRAHVETFFSDQKSRGFHIHKSHLSEPVRLMRLLIASCLAYLWLVYLGVCALHDDWLKRLHRQDRCDLSLFRLGLRLLARCLKDDIPLPEGFLVPARLPHKPIRQPLKRAA